MKNEAEELKKKNQFLEKTLKEIKCMVTMKLKIIQQKTCFKHVRYSFMQIADDLSGYNDGFIAETVLLVWK